MHDVPPRAAHFRPPPARIVITEAINNGVPNRLEVPEQKLFGQADPYWHYDETPVSKIRKTEIDSGVNGLGVVPQAALQNMGLGSSGTTPRAARIGLSYVYGRSKV